MTTAIARLGDLSSGHDGWPPTPSIEGSADTFVNNLPVVRLGDAYVGHTNSVGQYHDRVQAAGSSTYFINNKAVARLGDQLSCGDIVSAGSPDTFIG